jgi:hypothetical protein
MAVIAWTEIESFHNIKKFMRAYPENLNGNSVVAYRSKVKLHGTNAGVQVHDDGTIIPQSRTTELTLENDNAGFARWVMSNKEAWSVAKGHIIYGEWIGPGIQKGVAVSEIPKKCFAVFAARIIGENAEHRPDALFVEPDVLTKLVKCIPDTYVLPWFSDPLEVGWSDSNETLELVVSLINQWVSNVEANDPWVESTFGVKGTGEGLVFYPSSQSHLGLTSFNNLVFKAKGEKHKNIKSAAPAQVNPEVAASTDQFVEMVLTEARLEQGAAGNYDMKLVGKFLAWISADVQKETQDELEASGLTWKDVSKAIATKARLWYIEKAKL